MPVIGLELCTPAFKPHKLTLQALKLINCFGDFLPYAETMLNISDSISNNQSDYFLDSCIILLVEDFVWHHSPQKIWFRFQWDYDIRRYICEITSSYYSHIFNKWQNILHFTESKKEQWNSYWQGFSLY